MAYFMIAPELVEPARCGGSGATESLIEAIWPDAVRVATAILGDRSGGEDAAQEACIALYRGIGSLPSPTRCVPLQSDFERSCAIARAAIPVPTVPTARIRFAATTPSRTPTHRPRLAFGVATGALSFALIAAGAIVGLNGVHLTLGPSMGITVQYAKDVHGVSVRDPKPADLRSAAESADFAVRFPTGLPGDAPPKWMYRIGTSAITLVYDLPGAWRRNDHLLFITLANPKAVEGSRVARTAGDRIVELGPGGAEGRVTWQVGGELVIVPRSTIRPEELARIKRSMLEGR